MECLVDPPGRAIKRDPVLGQGRVEVRATALGVLEAHTVLLAAGGNLRGLETWMSPQLADDPVVGHQWTLG